MKKKNAILIISGQSSLKGLAVGDTIIGTGMMGRVNLQITGFKHQVQFKDQPIVLEVKTLEQNYFNDEYPITRISYNNYRSSAEVTTCTFTSGI